MNFELIHKNSAGIKRVSRRSLSFLGLVKHSTFSGAGDAYSMWITVHWLSEYFYYLQSVGAGFRRRHFIRPYLFGGNPTLTGQLSNKIGMAFADFLAKRIDGAKFTHTYEVAMSLKGHKISGDRPDLYCDTLSKQFALEVKGFTRSVSDNEMATHKVQSATGPLPINWSAACIAYKLYATPIVKYYDPVQPEVPYDAELAARLRDLYYARSVSFADEFYSEGRFEGPRKELVRFRDRTRSGMPSLLLHRSILDGEVASIEWLQRFETSEEGEQLYVDVDGIGFISDAT